MAIDLKNVNISLDEFQRISSGWATRQRVAICRGLWNRGTFRGGLRSRFRVAGSRCGVCPRAYVQLSKGGCGH